MGGDGLAAAAIWGETSERGGRGVYGYATNGSIEANYGGYFRSNGRAGRGVQGYAIGLTGRGVYGIATGGSGKGVDGYASNSGSVTNYGGYFRANGSTGHGVYGWVSDNSGINYGVRGKTNSPNGWAGYFEGRGFFSENVGIGTTTPEGALDVKSTSGALIVPRMTTTARDVLPNINGSIIYNTTTDKFNFRENGAWVIK